MWGRLGKIALSLPFLIVAGLFGLYLAFGFFLVDPLAKKLLPWIGENKLASQLSAQQVKFNPLTLEATVDGLKLAEMNGAPLAGFDRLYVNLDSTGLFRWAWRIRDVQLERPRAILTVQRGGKLNWAALIAKLNENKEPPSDTLARVLVDHVKISNGDIEYTDADRTGAPFKALLQPLGIELEGLSTLPEDRGDYLIAAKLPEQGGTLKWKGDVGLNPIASSGELGLQGVRLGNLLRVVKSPRNFELPSGTLAAGLRYRFAMVRDKTGEDVPWVQIGGANLVVQNLALAPRGDGVQKGSDPLRAAAPAPVLELAEARVGNASLDLAQRRIEVASVSLSGGKLAATRDLKGTLDWQTLFAAGEDAAAPRSAAAKPAAAETAAPPLPWKIDVREIKLADWAARFTDRSFAAPLGVSAEGFGLTAALTGELGAVAAIDVGPVNAALGPVRVQSGTQQVAELQRAALLNARLKLAENRLAIEVVELNGAKTSVTLDKRKTLNWAEILKPASGAPAAASAKAETAAASPMDVQLARLSLDGLEIGIVDQSPGAPVRLDVARGFLTLQNLSLDMNQAVPLQAGFALRQGGRFEAGGTVVPGKTSGRLDLKLAGLSLQPFAPYVNQVARLKLHSGVASSRGRLTFAQAKSGMKLDFDGGFAVDDLAITEEETEEAFLGWKKLSSDSLEFRLNPDRLHMNELVALNPFGKVIIFEDKSINLQRILRTPAQAPLATAPAKPLPAPQPAAQSAAFPLAVERLRIVGANAEFADLSLTPQFGTRMHDLGGVVTGLSTDPATMALVELDGKVDEFGSARVRGSIQPFRATDFTDLKLTFRNLEMTNMTPYSGKFAGRKIDSGKLSVDLEYKIKQRQLAGENKFVINKLKLGERVDSPDAMKLPLDLAIALLEDSEGIIDLDLPVTGSLDDPQFSYGKIIWKAVVNVLTKLVTAPFRALGSLLGISSDKLEAVEFDFGTATLLPPEQEKLKAVGQALAKRPQLALSIAPAYEVKGDTRAIQELWIRRDVAQRMGLKIDPGNEPGPVDTTNPRAQKALEALYGERFGKQGGVRAIKAEYAKAKEAGPSLHAAMLERLTLQIPVTEAELQRLAQARGEAVKQTLITLGQVDGAKIGVTEAVKNADGGKLVASKMNLQAGKKPAPAPASPAAPAAPVAPATAAP
ncbi:DUF748 domain-containing protein [Thiobacillus sp. 65-1402]|uniref:DUF748 domain-containing protein n=1 Tax=Thiobacillus sp. 65-1402 TaxID=1895861 RepID=UPI00095C37CA|nr:DUF748 domain-containing protein [Thiobacillus sp. 65-1402]OJW86973.1 MAG: hypothetical protein BGO62_13140 [Thiobacillus sp. 65-1402]